MKKKIIICIFLLLILATSIVSIASAIASYNYDMDPANGVDILEGLGAVLTIGVGGFVVLYELDLFYTVYYFFVRKKTVIKSILIVCSNIALLLVFFSDGLAYYLHENLNIFEEDWMLPIALLFIYGILKLIILAIPVGSPPQED